MDFISRYDSPLGEIILSCRDGALTGLWFTGQKYFASTLAGEHEEKATPVLKEAAKWLNIYFEGKNPDFTPPLSFESTGFRKSVWEILMTVPYGETVTYGSIARMLAGKTGAERVSARAVGNAVGHNPVSIIVPCHRVIGSGGKLTGYAGGVERKLKLLELERTAKTEREDEQHV